MATLPDIKIPGFLRRGYALMVSDEIVSLVSIQGGTLRRLGVFSNDQAGAERFADVVKSGKFSAEGKNFRILANVIGEDYRTEKVAHLIGKYRTDFHKRRMQKLFRNSPYCFSEVQGRDERGRREDHVLFFGILTEDKITPWVTQILRAGGVVVGVYNAAMVSPQILKELSGNTGGNCLLVTLHEKGLMRQTLFRDKKMRFSRVSKVADATAAEVAESLRREMERAIQYMNAQKVPVSDGINIHFICPSAMVSQLRETVPSGERIRVAFHDAGAIARSMGVSGSVEELGKDSSLLAHSVSAFLRLGQMSPFNLVRYYWARTTVMTASLLMAAYGAYNLTAAGGTLATGYFDYSTRNVDLADRANKLQNDYNAEVATIGDPPSSPENMRAVSNVFNALTEVEVSPSPLMYYFSEAYIQNSGVRVDNMRWWVSSEAGGGPEDLAIFNGESIFQTLEVAGMFEARPDETYLDVATRAEKLIDSFADRSDIFVEGVQIPRRELPASRFQGTLDEQYSVDAPESREFVIRIIWRQYDQESITKLMGEDLNI